MIWEMSLFLCHELSFLQVITTAPLTFSLTNVERPNLVVFFTRTPQRSHRSTVLNVKKPEHEDMHPVPIFYKSVENLPPHYPRL